MSNPFDDRYEAYYAAMTRAGLTPLSREWYERACAASVVRVAPHLNDAQFDHDTETREGWTE